MTVQVVFFTPDAIGSVHAPGVGRIRAREAVNVPGTTATVAHEGECVVVFNGETGAVYVAHGATPDATATAESATTSAGFPVASGVVSTPIVPVEGDKIHVAAVT